MHLFFLLAIGVSFAAAVFDMRTREMPNWLTLGGLVTGVALHAALGAARAGAVVGLREGAWSIAGAVASGFVPVVFWLRGAFGGGDVKMMAAVGALLLPVVGIEAEFYALVAAALSAPAYLAWDGKLLRTFANVGTMLLNPLRPKEKRREIPVEAMTQIRFGPAIFVGAALCAAMHWRDVS